MNALLYYVSLAYKKGKRHAREAVYGHLRPLNFWLVRPGKPRSLDRGQRLQIFFLELKVAPLVSNADEALVLIGKVLDMVEDTYSGIPKFPHPGLESNGRMYPPEDDMIKPDGCGGIIAYTRGHRIEIGVDGSMVFRCRAELGTVIFKKGGMNESNFRSNTNKG